MNETAKAFAEGGQTVIRLPHGVKAKAPEFHVSYDERSGQITLIPRDMRTAEERQRHWEELSRLAAEIPEEEWEAFDAAIKAGRACPKCGQ